MSAVSTWHPARGGGAAHPPQALIRAGGRLGRWIVGAIIAAVALTAGWWVTNSPVFDLRSIRVEGTEHLSAAQVRELSGLTDHTNVLWLSGGTVERRLERDPWILEASISRHLPGVVTIRVRERTPAAIMGTERVLVAADGTILGPARRGARLPVIDAPPGPLVVGQRVPPSAELTVAAALPPELRSRVASVTRQPDRSIVLELKDGTPILFGAGSTGVSAKAEVARALLAWATRHGVHPTYLDVRAPTAPAVGTVPFRELDVPGGSIGSAR